MIARCLQRLAPHVARGEIAITGGIALGRETGDIDLVVARRESVLPSICDVFLLSHYHAGEKLLVQLVDPETRLRVDIFLDATGAIAEAHEGPHGWLVLDDDDLLDHKLGLLARASSERPVDPKHADDARLLAARLMRPPPIVDPAVLAPVVYATDPSFTCERCEIDPAWPLAAKTQILALLGYV